MVIAGTPNLPIAGDLNMGSGFKDAAIRVDRVARAQRAVAQERFVFTPNCKISALLCI